MECLNLNLLSVNDKNSLLPEIINTIYIEVIALALALPIGFSTALYITHFAKNKAFVKLIDFSTEILASIPSILFGMFGYYLFCIFFGLKCSILSGGLTMTICVLPIIIQTTKHAILNVPKTYEYAALALGTSKLKTIFHIIMPCATSGILTGTILAIGKIVGESAALLLTAGTSTKLPSNILNHIFSSGQTLSLHLYFISGNSSTANSINICFATATILMILTFILNCLIKLIAKTI